MEAVIRNLKSNVAVDKNRMSSDIPRMILYFLLGFGLSSILFVKLNYDQTSLLNLLFSVDTVTEKEVDEIWSTSDMDGNDELSIDDFAFVLIKIYQLQAQKLFATKKSKTYVYILELYKRLGLFDAKTFENLSLHVKIPLTLKRCNNIIKQLNENNSMMVPMLIPKLATTTVTKAQFIQMIPKIVYESLRCDLYDFIEYQQKQSSSPSSNDNDDSTNPYSHSASSVTSEPPLMSAAYYQFDQSSIGSNDINNDTFSTSYTTNETAELSENVPEYNVNSNIQRNKRKPRQSDVYDYLTKM